jgi:hypothetical protein
LALGGRREVATHINQPRVNSRGRRYVGEEARPGQSMCLGASSHCLGASYARTKKIEMKYIVAVDGRQFETYHTTTNHKWEETMEQSIERRCHQKEVRVGCCSTVFYERQVKRK